jgi:hypothetical protein
VSDILKVRTEAVPRARTRGEIAFTWLSARTALAIVLVVGCIVRWTAAITLTPHVDEPSSVLAAHVVAERGLPILPSGTPYFQGVTLSYLLVPFVWLGYGGIDHLHVMRMVLVAAGTLTLWLCYRLCTEVTGDARVGIVMAALVALDPVSTQWSAHVRMYGLLQLATVALALAWIRLLNGNTSWRQVATVVGIFWFAVFTHVGGALLGLAMALAAFAIHRFDLIRRVRILITLALSALAPALLLIANRSFSTSNEPVRESSSVPFWSFVGDNLLAPLARLRISGADWQDRLTAGITLYWLVPGLIVAIATIAGARYLLRRADVTPERRRAVIALLAMYWLPMLIIVVFTVSPKVRYLMHLHVLGYFFLAVLVVTVLERAGGIGLDWRGKALRYGAVAVIVVAIAAGLRWRLDNPVVQPDYNDAMAYVADHHQPGEPVIVTLPPVGYLSIDESSRDDLYFLAGSEGWTRAERYTRWSDDGRLIDYWIGADSIVSMRTLDDILEHHPDAWVVADVGRLRDDWTDASSIREYLSIEMYPAYASEGGAVVFRLKPDEVRSASTEHYRLAIAAAEPLRVL